MRTQITEPFIYRKRPTLKSRLNAVSDDGEQRAAGFSGSIICLRGSVKHSVKNYCAFLWE